jgi:CheY-like chemotaxis protein
MTETTIRSYGTLNHYNKSKGQIITQSFKILIVDDDNDTAESFAEILRNRGHLVTVANEGIVCVGKCQNYNYDIIFMDFHMDNVDGVDTADLIKNICHKKSIIFAFTGDDSNFALSKFRNIGMAGAIIKPLDIDLINKLMTSLEIRSDVDTRIIKSIRNIKSKRQLFVFGE